MSMTQDDMMAQEGMAPQGEMGAPAAPPQDPAMQEQQAQLEQIAQSAPAPEKPYSPKAIEKFSKSINDFMSKIDDTFQAVEYDVPDDMKKWPDPLPAEVFVPYVLIMAYVDGLGDFEKFVVDPMELGKGDTALSKASANLGRMGKDKKLVAKLQEPPGGEQPEQEEAPEMSEAEMRAAEAPAGMDQDDEAISQIM